MSTAGDQGQGHIQKQIVWIKYLGMRTTTVRVTTFLAFSLYFLDVLLYKVFEYNLANTKSDKKNEEASIDFLDELTDIIDRLEIKLINIVPDDRQKVGKYTYIPYDIELSCDYEKFGKFIAELEKDSRLINIDEFRLFNKVEKASSKRSIEALLNNKIELTISTITLNKSKG